MDKKELKNSEKELEEKVTTEDTVEEVAETEVTEETKESEEKSEEKEETKEETKEESKEETKEETKEESKESEDKEETEEASEESDDEDESKDESEEADEEKSKEESEEKGQQKEEELAEIALKEEQEAIKKAAFKKAMKVVTGGLAAVAVIAAGAYYWYDGYYTDFTMDDYTALEFYDIEYMEVTDEYVESYMEDMLVYNSVSKAVDRQAVDGDIVNIDYVGTVDGEEFAGGTSEEHDLLLGSGSFIDDFEDQLIGSKAGDEVQVEVTFPEEYHNEEMAGVDAVFAVTVNAVKEEVERVLNETYVQAASETATTVEEYIEEIKAELVQQSEDAYKYGLQSEAWNIIYGSARANKYPSKALAVIKDRFDAAYHIQAESYDMTMDEFIEYVGLDQAGYEEFLTTSAKEQFITEEVVNRIRAAENIGNDIEDMGEEVLNLVVNAGFADVDEAMELGYSIEELEFFVYSDLVQAWLVECSTILPMSGSEQVLDLGDIDISEYLE